MVSTHLKNMLVKMGSSSPNRDENKKYLKPPASKGVGFMFLTVSHVVFSSFICGHPFSDFFSRKPGKFGFRWFLSIKAWVDCVVLENPTIYVHGGNNMFGSRRSKSSD